MKCEYWYLDHCGNGKVTHCDNEAVGEFACDFLDAVVCEKHRCRCYKTCPAWTDEEMKEFIKAREERNKRRAEKKLTEK
jgi:hypothetical protein